MKTSTALPAAIQTKVGTPSNMRIGVVQSVSSTRVVVNVAGALLPVPYLNSYLPIVGDNVSMIFFGATWLVLGAAATASPPRNGIVVAPLTTVSSGTPTSGTTEVMDAVLGVYTFRALAGIRYRMILSGRGVASTVASDRYSVSLRYTTDGTTPTNTSTLIEHVTTFIQIVTGGNGIYHIPHIVTFIPGAAVVNVMSGWIKTTGTGVGTPAGTCSLWAEAIGNV
jgi:hypothetical protein